MLTLYFAPGASSMAVHIALHEIGLPFEGRPISLAKREQQASGYLALNPEGKVPTLLIDGRPLTEVAAILYFLANRFPQATLLPQDDVEGQAQAISWMSFIASTLHPARRLGMEGAKKVYGLADTKIGRTGMGAGALFDCRHPSVSALLAFCQFRETSGWNLPSPFRPLRPHDDAAGGAADMRDRSGDRL